MKSLNVLQVSECPVIEGAIGFGQFVRDPNRLDTVFEIAEKLIPLSHRERSARKMRERSRQIAQSFDTRLRLAPIRLEDFRHYPPNTLGHAYFQFMSERNLTPESIPTRDHVSDADYFIASSYETHDLWHVVTGFDTTVAGELGLQAYYTTQTPFGLSAVILFGGFLNALIFNPKDFLNRFREFRRGRRLGKNAKNIFGVNWDLYWTKSLSEIRREFRIEV